MQVFPVILQAEIPIGGRKGLIPLLGSYYKLSDRRIHLKRSNGSLDPAMPPMVRD